jgi:hypothetical protein
MKLTVTSSDANLPVTWCGIEWVKSEAGGGPADPLAANQRRSGEQATICPTSYVIGQGTVAPPSTVQFARERWQFNSHLRLTRGVIDSAFFGNCYFDDQYNRLKLLTTLDDSRSIAGCTGPTTSTPQNDLSMILSVIMPTYSEYLIQNEFFTSYNGGANPGITSGGVTYYWERGNGWP